MRCEPWLTAVAATPSLQSPAPTTSKQGIQSSSSSPTSHGAFGSASRLLQTPIKVPSAHAFPQCHSYKLLRSLATQQASRKKPTVQLSIPKRRKMATRLPPLLELPQDRFAGPVRIGQIISGRIRVVPTPIPPCPVDKATERKAKVG